MAAHGRQGLNAGNAQRAQVPRRVWRRFDGPALRPLLPVNADGTMAMIACFSSSVSFVLILPPTPCQSRSDFLWRHDLIH